MRENWLKFLKSPINGKDLYFKNKSKIDNKFVIEGELSDGVNTFKIINGIPRFTSQNDYNLNFSINWKKFPKTQFENSNKNSPLEGLTNNMFNLITDKNNFNNLTVLDAGCGSGRFLDRILNHKPKLVIAIEYSDSVDVAKKNIGNDIENIFFIQGDLLKIPLKDNIIDFVISIGVLHHTPKPHNCFLKIYDVLKSNGYFALAVYRHGYYSLPTVKILRYVINKLPKKIAFKFAYNYSVFCIDIIDKYFFSKSKFIRKYMRFFIPYIFYQDRDWSILDTFDSITPKYQFTFSKKDMFNWFNSSLFYEVKETKWKSFIGRKIETTKNI